MILKTAFFLSLTFLVHSVSASEAGDSRYRKICDLATWVQRSEDECIKISEKRNLSFKLIKVCGKAFRSPLDSPGKLYACLETINKHNISRVMICRREHLHPTSGARYSLKRLKKFKQCMKK